MVHKEPSEGKKRKPRGRPFTSEYNPRKSKNDFLATARRERRDRGEDIAPNDESLKEEPLKQELEQSKVKKRKRDIRDMHGVPHDESGITTTLEQGAGVESLKEGFDEYQKNLGAIEPGQEVEVELGHFKVEQINIPEPTKEGEIIDSIEFKNGSNVLKIVFKKQHNRSFRIQAFLNETTEIRPVTYTGSSTASSFWSLLKGSLKKD